MDTQFSVLGWELEALRDEQKVGHCLIIRDGEETNHWWLAGNIEGTAYSYSTQRKKR